MKTERSKTTKLHCLASSDRRLGVLCKRRGQNLIVMERGRFAASTDPERCERCAVALTASSAIRAA